MLISYCVVNTNGRELLMRCLDAIESTHPPELEREVLVLDNASDDGSAEAVAARVGDEHSGRRVRLVDGAIPEDLRPLVRRLSDRL